MRNFEKYSKSVIYTGSKNVFNIINSYQALKAFYYHILPSCLILFFLLSCCPNSHISNRYLLLSAKSPEQVVEHHQQTFGTPRMDEIGPYTTDNFRNHLPITVWISKTWEVLRKIGYEKVAFKLLDTEYSDDENSVKITVAAKIITEAASATQKEIYLLIKKDGYWLVDELIVTDEVLDEEVFEL